MVLIIKKKQQQQLQQHLKLEWFSVECRKTKTKVITHQSQRTHTICTVNQSKFEVILNAGKRGKTRASESRLVFVLLLING